MNIIRWQCLGYGSCYNLYYRSDMLPCPQTLISGHEADGTQRYEYVRLNESLGASCGLRKSSAGGFIRWGLGCY